MYYLQSRYYDPAVGRFINADRFASTGQGLLGHNMFSYCINNPVALYDPDGTVAAAVQTFLEVLLYGAASCLDGPLPIIDIAVSIIIISRVSQNGSENISAVSPQKNFPPSATEDAPAFNAPIARSAAQSNAAEKRRKIYSYWAAYLLNGEVVIGRGLTFNEACARVASFGDVMCKNYSAAMAIVVNNHYRNYVGPERHRVKKRIQGTTQWGYWHLHANANHGSKRAPNIGVHIWYYGGKYG